VIKKDVEKGDRKKKGLKKGKEGASFGGMRPKGWLRGGQGEGPTRKSGEKKGLTIAAPNHSGGLYIGSLKKDEGGGLMKEFTEGREIYCQGGYPCRQVRARSA